MSQFETSLVVCSQIPGKAKTKEQHGAVYKEAMVPQMLDIIWENKPNYPWWPGIIRQSPSNNRYLKLDKRGKIKAVHLQFFEETPTGDLIHLEASAGRRCHRG
jgi:hypothetical protein